MLQVPADDSLGAHALAASSCIPCVPVLEGCSGPTAVREEGWAAGDAGKAPKLSIPTSSTVYINSTHVCQVVARLSVSRQNVEQIVRDKEQLSLERDDVVKKVLTALGLSEQVWAPIPMRATLAHGMSLVGPGIGAAAAWIATEEAGAQAVRARPDRA